MNNKKVLLVVLLAAFLAFCAVYLSFKTHKATPQKDVIIQEVENNTETSVKENTEPNTEDLTEESDKNIEQSKTVSTKPISRTISKPKMNPQKAVDKSVNQLSKEEIKEETTELQSEISITEEHILEKEVIVPVKYPQNTHFKYVYTPARFKSK